jgi:hypothetical protein
MTKQQLREAIRRVIKQELLNEALGFLPPMQVAYFEGYDDAKKGKPADVNYFRKHMELDEEKTVPNPNAGKWRIVGIESGAPLTKEFYKSKEEAQAAAKELGRIKSSGIKYVQLKDTMKVHEGPAVAPDETEEDVETIPYTLPNEDDDDLNIGGNPNTNPKMPPQAITPKEESAIDQIIARYISTLNLNERKKYK